MRTKCGLVEMCLAGLAYESGTATITRGSISARSKMGNLELRTFISSRLTRMSRMSVTHTIRWNEIRQRETGSAQASTSPSRCRQTAADTAFCQTSTSWSYTTAPRCRTRSATECSPTLSRSTVLRRSAVGRSAPASATQSRWTQMPCSLQLPSTPTATPLTGAARRPTWMRAPFAKARKHAGMRLSAISRSTHCASRRATTAVS